MSKRFALFLTPVLAFSLVGMSLSVCLEMESNSECHSSSEGSAGCCSQEMCQLGQHEQRGLTQKKSSVLVISPLEYVSFSESVERISESPASGFSRRHRAYESTPGEVYLLNAVLLI
jgi:hypothetical protein